ncbi:MAG: hypothetical protein AB7Q97_26160 [Gammaproteobacteria bacterium]
MGYVKQSISLQVDVDWYRPRSNDAPWAWGDRKDTRSDPAWSKRNIIYRWVRASDAAIAMIGETERLLTERVDNYIHAKAEGRAGPTNKRLNEEARSLLNGSDTLYIEITSEVPGYDLSDTRERRFAECLLTAVCRPYLK